MDHSRLVSVKCLIENIGELVTLAPLANEGRTTRITGQDLGVLQDAYLLVNKGKIVDYGSGEPPPAESFPRIDAKNGLVLPGLIDCHTHPIFAGDRSNEFAQRLDGKTYPEIAAAGGGIAATVLPTRDTERSRMVTLIRKRLARFLKYGVTTLEAKSGYGLSVKSELESLRALKQATLEVDQTVHPTCLALHAVPANTQKQPMISAMIDVLLPQVASEGLARSVDAFIEQGYFSVEDVEPYVQRARELGLELRIHADEFSDAGAASAAARWQAKSADHLQFAPIHAAKEMAKASVTAVLLPGTSLYTGIPYTAAEKFRTAGCAIALATDFNPGSCVIDNLNLVATLGALHCGLSTAEAIAAVTYVPACSLGLGQTKGALARSFDADFSIYPLRTTQQWIADLGRHPPNAIFISGKLAHIDDTQDYPY